ncbi:MAG TPA: FAD-dependent thymidylate synthase [Acidimicrobiales bacterium]|nr:FAD-dependent thymidylate synthase [Acidimicrobiales bacterium]
MTVYVSEDFTPAEADVLRRYFTNLDGPVFALVNLPEVVKGALFARYSRSPKSLRRLFLDEFVGDLDIAGDASIDATVGLQRAEELYDRVFFEYGDDSVAQLGGVHLACEQASNLLTKVLEWGRLMSYLEQSTRYIAYDARIGGRYRYHRDPAVLGSSLGLRYVGDLDRLFDTYAEMASTMIEFFRERFPKDPADSDFVYRQALKAKALDAVRGLLPAAALSNVGIYGTGQAYEALLVRMRSHPLPEARSYADLMLTELRKVIPSFLKRVDLTDRGVAASTYLAAARNQMEEIAARLFGGGAGDAEHGREDGREDGHEGGGPSVQLVDFDPDAEVKLVASMLYPYTELPDALIEDRVRAMGADQRIEIVRAYVGDRTNRRHRPGRAFERPSYRFDVLADYGAFRDLQRHRMLTIEWQPLSPRHGYTRPEAIDLAGLAEDFDDAMERSASLHDALVERFPVQAAYAVSLAYRVRFAMQLNAREAMHLIELRSTPQGHPAYRVVAQQMHRLIADQAGHHAVAEAMRFADHSPEPSLERLDGERRAERRRLSQ